MEKEKIIEIVNNVDKKSNKDLNNALGFLKEEFDKTKEIIISLTRHMDAVEDGYNKILNEINKRKPL